jgi:hypothetical protein
MRSPIARHVRMLALVLVASLFASPPLSAQAPPRALADAMRAIFVLRDYTAFDWISGNYLKGTLTLRGWVRTEQLKRDAVKAARSVAGIDDIIDEMAVLPALGVDDDIRVRAYVAVYASPALERYGPGGQFSGAALADLADSARFGLDAGGIGRGPHSIHIVVNGARVLLLGQVSSRGDRQIAEASLRTLSGVLGVTNQLRVAGEK